MGARLTELFEEATRRRVFRATGLCIAFIAFIAFIVYIFGFWDFSQGLVELVPPSGVSEKLLRALPIGVLALAPLVVVLSLMFDIGDTGVKRESKDVERAREDDDLALMQTQVGPGSDPGAIAIGWPDRDARERNPFLDEFFTGRAIESRIRSHDPLVSRKHARVFLLDGARHIEGPGSRNGTTVNGWRADGVGDARLRRGLCQRRGRVVDDRGDRAGQGSEGYPGKVAFRGLDRAYPSRERWRSIGRLGRVQ